MKNDESTLKPLREELESAHAEVLAAEQALDGLLAELRSGVRAEKVTITTVLEDAFSRLRSGRIALAKVREIVVKDD